MLDYVLLFIVYFPGVFASSATTGTSSFMTLEDCHAAGAQLIEASAMAKDAKVIYICSARGES